MSGEHKVVEYGDFECPYCGSAYPELKELRRRLATGCRDKVRADRAEGVSGTPALFLDGERYDGFYDAEMLADLLR